MYVCTYLYGILNGLHKCTETFIKSEILKTLVIDFRKAFSGIDYSNVFKY